MIDALLTPNEVATELRLAPSTVRRMLVEGRLCAYVRTGRYLRVRRETFEAWQREQEERSQQVTSGGIKPWEPDPRSRLLRSTESSSPAQPRDQTPTRSAA